ncbi:hypothetical protein VB715_02095 [Crocosphaera sp. UHCC 0190]|uniref:hypothetical protein n=1 Tax=Crocosphaera sp. UHCC 0190 TaxID=3110246 RepID=UPI002B208747|nr:hypothetical protein [Crocosphaera sp. UHCC 0190]MEA5508547.1 hypothetical protein [Crocosphaera sp. UHCC 0190]
MKKSVQPLNQAIHNQRGNYSKKVGIKPLVKEYSKHQSKSIVDQIRERRPVPNPWRVGEVAQIMIKGNPDLKGRNGQWCIVEEVLNFSCLVRTWDGIIQVKIENLKDFYYSSQQQQEMKRISDRLSKLSLENLEDSVKGFLGELGKIDRPFLSQREDTILSLLEEE